MWQDPQLDFAVTTGNYSTNINSIITSLCTITFPANCLCFSPCFGRAPTIYLSSARVHVFLGAFVAFLASSIPRLVSGLLL